MMDNIAPLPEEPSVLYNISHSEATVPELNITLSAWDQHDWQEKAANARLPYTPSYASFNSPSSNVSALSGPLDDDFEYNLVNEPYNSQSYPQMPEEGHTYPNHLAFHPGGPSEEFGALGHVHDPSSSSTPYTLLEDQFPGASAASGSAISPEEYFTYPSETPEDLSQPSDHHSFNQGQVFNPNSMFNQYAPRQGEGDQSPSPASSSGDADQRPNQSGYSDMTRTLSHQPSPMMGNNVTPIGFAEGLAGLNFAAGLVADMESKDNSARSPPADTPTSQSSQASAASAGASTLLGSPTSNDVAQPQPTRPPGLQDFIGGPSMPQPPLTSLQFPISQGIANSLTLNAPPLYGHRPRSASHSGTSAMGLGTNIGFESFYTAGAESSTSNAGSSTLQPSWPEAHPYYPSLSSAHNNESQASSTIDPRDANSLDATGLVVLHPSPPSDSRPPNANFHSAPTLSITQHHSGSSVSPSSPLPPPTSHALLPSASTSSLTPGLWNNPSAALKRNKTTGSALGFGHRRNAHSEDVRSLSPTWASDALGGRRSARDFDALGQDGFLRSITRPDGSLAPPSVSNAAAAFGASNSGYFSVDTAGSDSPGLGLGDSNAASLYSSNFAVGDEEDVGGIGAQRGRRRGSSASSHSPYSRPLSISPSGGRLELAGNGFASGSGGTSNGKGNGGAAKNAAGEPDIVPVSSVERQHVTTPATEIASQNRRKNKAQFVCPVEGCSSTFTRQFNLKGHLRSHREERPFICGWENCGKGFARQHDCKRHEALHLNIRPHTCEGCGKTFARMDALNRHHKSDGGTECRNSANQDDSSPERPSSSSSAAAAAVAPTQPMYPKVPVIPNPYFANNSGDLYSGYLA